MVTYRRWEQKDIPLLIRLRLAQLKEEGVSGDEGALQKSLSAYYRRHLEDGSFAAFLAEENGEAVGSSGMSLAEKPPYYSNPTGKIGLLSGMYTLPAFRRRGIAKKLLSLAVEEARRWGCGAVQITASDKGVLLYESFGFQKNENFRQYVISL